MKIVSPSTLTRPDNPEPGFSTLLKAWRQRRRLSQMDLALSSEVSQRHVSFLESGRAQPSRGMTVEIARGGVRVSLFTVIATFGTAQDVTTDELRLECMFPADAATERLFRAPR